MNTSNSINSLLQPFKRFGVHLGLERIHQLLAKLDNPHQQFPIIHVAGTNGKGSVCAYLSSVLVTAGYKVGRYTSPHLIDWTERICINNQPIYLTELEQVIVEVTEKINPEIEAETPTQFEVFTAAAWLYFARENVDIAVIEVGLGGRLDATNVRDRALVSVITSLSREHWQTLGPTLTDIAREKAGVLKPNCPAVIGQLPLEAKTVVEARIKELNCPVTWVEPAQKSEGNRARFEGNSVNLKAIEYPLSLLGEMQLMNSAIAIATLQQLQRQGWDISTEAIQRGMGNTRWLGRVQWITWRDRELLIDGAHNPAAATALRQYVDTLDAPITWVMGILSTKDHADIFSALLRPGNRLYLVPVPDHSSADPEQLSAIARSRCPQLETCKTFPNLLSALENALARDRQIILCGSLYLVGYFLKLNQISTKSP
ncbi:bifunctional folylpolyglutamate synthase/dihydrofolate synthase [Lusitaniella coriacea]|uniref:bifunctional folylpolyglutamate synthase/dihydrofolate synthase n=1 Tax=Lusitaniella coriacea TaxID=1983105 RepID=UPI003CF9B31D